MFSKSKDIQAVAIFMINKTPEVKSEGNNSNTGRIKLSDYRFGPSRQRAHEWFHWGEQDNSSIKIAPCPWQGSELAASEEPGRELGTRLLPRVQHLLPTTGQKRKSKLMVLHLFKAGYSQPVFWIWFQSHCTCLETLSCSEHKFQNDIHAAAHNYWNLNTQIAKHPCGYFSMHIMMKLSSHFPKIHPSVFREP